SVKKGWLTLSFEAASVLLALALLDARAQTHPNSATNELANRLAERNNRFGFELMAKLHKDGENLFISPFSIASALQMTSGSAAGQTLAEMLRTMHVEDLELLAANRALIDLSLAHADGTLALANSLWGNSEIVKLNEDFAVECRKYYSAEVRTLPFEDPSTLVTINGWIKDRTAGKIPHLLDKIPGDAAGYLISAVHFKGAWHRAFDGARTQETDFMLIGGSTKKVKMMNATDEYPYVETEEYQGVGLSFGQKQHVVMWFIIPAKGRRLSDVLSGLDAEKLKEISAAPRRRGSVSIPRFKLRYKSELTDSLRKMGMLQAFDAHTADFSHFSSSGGRFVISRVLHEALLEVNEAGAEAAAATAVEAMPTSVALPRDRPFRFVADQPFFVAIIDEGAGSDRGTGAVLFAGSVYDPASQ
ncbi:MAG TPA: serpin family protein, partial [Myxococcota bacterium]|nr:serpin family protein [Myxococcota bacterium]